MRFPTEEEDRMFEAIKPYLDERCKLKIWEKIYRRTFLLRIEVFSSISIELR